MTKLTEAFTDQVFDDLLVLDLCAKALRAEDVEAITCASVAHLLESISARMGHTSDMLDAMLDGRTVAVANPAEPEPPVDDLVVIGRGVLELWERYAARRRAVNNGEN